MCSVLQTHAHSLILVYDIGKNKSNQNQTTTMFQVTYHNQNFSPHSNHFIISVFKGDFLNVGNGHKATIERLLQNGVLAR